jgi:AcrR family transcriptional regulator
MPRPALSRTELDRQRQRALDAALALFAARGVESVSMRSVAAALDLSAMALYRYFPGGKAEILATIRGSGFEALAAEFERARANSPLDMIIDIVRAALGFARQRPQLYRLMFDITQPEERAAYLATRRRHAWRLVSAPFAAAIDAGLLDGDPETLPHVFFAALHGVILLDLSGQPDARRRIDRLVAPTHETLFRGSGASAATLRKIRGAFPRPSTKDHP